MPNKVVKKKASTLQSQKPAAVKKSEYTAKQITVLEGLDPVRKRPGMYIGSTGPAGLHHLIWEAVDNGIDEAMAGFCDRVTVSLLPEGKVKVTDNGRGIPVDKHPITKLSALETVMTKLHAGGKFGGEGYKVSGGLHGVGISVVNALSDWMRTEVERDGKVWVQEYQKGKTKAKLKAIGTSKETGTSQTWHPDPEIFSSLEFDYKILQNNFNRQCCYFHNGCKKEAFKTTAFTITTRNRRKKWQSYEYYSVTKSYQSSF